MAVPGPSSQPKLVTSLPYAIQQNIVGHIDRRTLLKVQRVSRHFHTLASELVYASLRFRLSNFYLNHESRFASALNTLTTSDHDYTQYVKKLTVELANVDSESNQQLMAAKYHHGDDPSKLLNILLLLFFRKTKALETLSWFVPVEFSPQVYDALGKIRCLSHLSLSFETVLMSRMSTSTAHPPPPPPPGVASSLNPPVPYWPPPPPGPAPVLFSHGSSSKSNQLALATQQQSLPGISRKLSAFADLRSLDLRGIDDLECAAEIASCLAASATSLKTLTLALSKHLTKQAKKPAENTQPVPPPQPFDDGDDAMTDEYPATNPSEPAPLAKPAEIKKIREELASFLAKVFGLETADREARKVDKALKHASAQHLPTATTDVAILNKWREGFVQKFSEIKSDGGVGNDESEALKHSRNKKLFGLLIKAVDNYIQLRKQVLQPTAAAAAKPKPTGYKPAKKSKKPPKPHTHASQYMPYSYSYQYGTDPLANLDPDLLASIQQNPIGQSSSSTSDPKKAKAIQDILMYGSAYGGNSSSTPLPGTENVWAEPSPILNSLPPPLPASGTTAVQGSMAISQGLSVLDDPLAYPFPSYSTAQLVPSNGSNAKKKSKSKQPIVYDENSESESSDEDEQSGTGYQGKASASQQQKDEGEEAAVIEDEEDGLDFDIDMEHPDLLSGDDDVNDPEDRGDSQDSDEDDESREAAGSSVAKSGDDSPSANGISSGSRGASTPVEDIRAEPAGKRLSDISALRDLPNGKGKQAVPMNGANSSNVSFKLEEQASSKTATLGAASGRQPGASTDDIMKRYLLMKHGFSIQNLNLYLTPLKPSVLGRALDLSCLKSLTLLSVGPQGAFWTLLSNQQRDGLELQLRTIHTDDVSMAFLTFVSEMPELHNLYMLRRSSKDFDSTTSKTPATLEEIRTLALRKHARHLQRLSLKSTSNEHDWDLEKRSLRLLASMAVSLKELHCAIAGDHFHEFIRALPRFQSLVAINLYKLPSSHPLHWTVKEIRRSVIDILDLAPSVSLRVLVAAGMNYRFKVKARQPDSQRPASTSAKGKGKARASDLDGVVADEDQAASEIENEGSQTQITYPSRAELEREFPSFDMVIRVGRIPY